MARSHGLTVTASSGGVLVLQEEGSDRQTVARLLDRDPPLNASPRWWLEQESEWISWHKAEERRRRDASLWKESPLTGEQLAEVDALVADARAAGRWLSEYEVAALGAGALRRAAPPAATHASAAYGRRGCGRGSSPGPYPRWQGPAARRGAIRGAKVARRHRGEAVLRAGLFEARARRAGTSDRAAGLRGLRPVREHVVRESPARQSKSGRQGRQGEAVRLRTGPRGPRLTLDMAGCTAEMPCQVPVTSLPPSRLAGGTWISVDSLMRAGRVCGCRGVIACAAAEGSLPARAVPSGQLPAYGGGRRPPGRPGWARGFRMPGDRLVDAVAQQQPFRFQGHVVRVSCVVSGHA